MRVSDTRFVRHVSAYAGSPGNLTEVACSDPDYSFQRHIEFMPTAGTTYYIMVAGQVYLGSSMSLTLSEIAIPPHVALAVNDTGAVNAKTGIATVTGNISCTPACNDNFVTTLAVNGILTQRLGRQTYQANFCWAGTCTAGPIPWSATAQSSQDLFIAGKAMVKRVSVCTQFSRRRLRLRCVLSPSR